MFKDNLVQLRKAREMTQEDLAEKIGVSRQSVAKWEAGDSLPDIDRCKSIAETEESMKKGNILVDQVTKDGVLVEGFDQSLSPQEIFQSIAKYYTTLIDSA